MGIKSNAQIEEEKAEAVRVAVAEALAAANAEKKPDPDAEKKPDPESKPGIADATISGSQTLPPLPMPPSPTIMTDDAGVIAAINRMGENFDLISVDALGEIDEETDLPPGVSTVKMMPFKGEMRPVVYWQLGKEKYASNKRKPYCKPILRSNPHFAHIPDTQFDVYNQLTNGDLIVCYTSEEMARAYHNRGRANVDRRNAYMYEGGPKHRDSQDAGGETVRAAYQQSVTVGADMDNETVYDRAMGNTRGGRGGR